MNKPITTRINQASSLGMKVREPFLNVGEVKSPGKQKANEPVLEKGEEGYVLNPDGTVAYGGNVKITVPGKDKMGYSGKKMKLTDKQKDWRNKEIERLGGVQQYRDHYKIGKKVVVGKEEDQTKDVPYKEGLKKKIVGTQDAPFVARMQIRGDKILKNKAQKQAIKTARQAGEFKGQSKVSQFMDALKTKKEDNASYRRDKQKARQDKRKAMKALRAERKEAALTETPMTDAQFQKKKKGIKAEKANTLEKSQSFIDANKKKFKETVGNIEGNKVKKAIKNEYNKKLKTALDAKLDNRVAAAQQGVKIGGKVDLGGADLEMQDLTIPNQINAIQNKPIKSPNNKIKTPAYKMHPKSPIAKALVGNQHKLPQHLQDAIKAAPGKAYKKY